jgi:hypothetical protein
MEAFDINSSARDTNGHGDNKNMSIVNSYVISIEQGIVVKMDEL